MIAFLNNLAVARSSSASTRNQALCALLFLYRRVLNMQLPRLEALERDRRPDRLPAVLSRQEVVALLDSASRRRQAKLAAGHGEVERRPLDVIRSNGR